MPCHYYDIYYYYARSHYIIFIADIIITCHYCHCFFAIFITTLLRWMSRWLKIFSLLRRHIINITYHYCFRYLLLLLLPLLRHYADATLSRHYCHYWSYWYNITLLLKAIAAITLYYCHWRCCCYYWCHYYGAIATPLAMASWLLRHYYAIINNIDIAVGFEPLRWLRY